MPQRSDAKVIEFLSKHDFVWTSQMIADGLAQDREAVVDSLQRLEARGRVLTGSGTTDNPSRTYRLNHL
jgi:hypothetical protein